MVDGITKNYPVINTRDPLQDNIFTCNMAQTNLDNQVLSMMEKQPWKEAPKEKNGTKRKNYKCNVCNLLSRGRLDCMKHVETHISNLRYTCMLCKRITKTKSNMKVHLEAHEQTNQGSNLPKLSYLDLDIVKSTEENDLYQCNMDLNEIKYQSLTIIEKQEETGSHGHLYKCNVCSLVSRDKRDCIKHVEKHIDGLIYTCLLCNQTMKTKSSMKIHVLKHGSMGKDGLLFNPRKVIDISSFTNINWDTLEDKISSMIEKSEKQVNGKRHVDMWTCTVCGKVSMQRNHSVAHVETHLEGLLYSCPRCSYTCKTRCAIRVHLGAAH